jgi:hypothetical protein
MQSYHPWCRTRRRPTIVEEITHQHVRGTVTRCLRLDSELATPNDRIASVRERRRHGRLLVSSASVMRATEPSSTRTRSSTPHAWWRLTRTSPPSSAGRTHPPTRCESRFALRCALPSEHAMRTRGYDG